MTMNPRPTIRPTLFAYGPTTSNLDPALRAWGAPGVGTAPTLDQYDNGFDDTVDPDVDSMDVNYPLWLATGMNAWISRCAWTTDDATRWGFVVDGLAPSGEDGLTLSETRQRIKWSGTQNRRAWSCSFPGARASSTGVTFDGTGDELFDGGNIPEPVDLVLHAVPDVGLFTDGRDMADEPGNRDTYIGSVDSVAFTISAPSWASAGNNPTKNLTVEIGTVDDAGTFAAFYTTASGFVDNPSLTKDLTLDHTDLATRGIVRGRRLMARITLNLAGTGAKPSELAGYDVITIDKFEIGVRSISRL